MNLIDAVVKKNIAQIKQLLESGADPNMSLDEAKVTPLHFAAQLNAVEIAKLLLAAGADPNAVTEPDGQTPLEVAQLHQAQSIIKLLSAYIKTSE